MVGSLKWVAAVIVQFEVETVLCNEMETMQWAPLGGHKVMRASKGFF